MNKKIIMWIIVLISLISYTYADCTTIDNIRAYYSFDSSLTTDDSGNGYTLTNNGVTSVSGKLGNAGDYEVSENDYMQNDAVAGSWVDDGGSMCLWVKMESTSDQQFINLGDAVTQDYVLMRLTSDNFVSETYPNLNKVTDSTNRNTDVDWHHLCMTWDATAHINKFYVDGSSIGSASANSPILNSITKFHIGVGWWAGSRVQYYDGLIDEVIVTTDELSVAEIGDLYNSGDACNPFGVSGTLILNTNLVQNTNSTNNPFTFDVNGTVSATTDIWNVTFYVNGSIEDTVINTPLNDTNIQFNFSDGNGAYEFNITALNNESVIDSFTRNVFIDTVQPKITIISGLTNNTVFDKNDGITLKVNYTDTNLEAINFTIYRLNTDDSVDIELNNTFVQSILTDRYELNFTDDFTNANWLQGRDYKLDLSAYDGHTTTELISSPKKVINSIHYRGLKFYCDKTHSMSWELTRDSVKPIIEFTTPAKRQTCYYETNGEWDKVKRVDESLSMWYVDIGNRFWIDAKHENVEVDLVEPNLLKIVYVFDNPVQSFQTQTFGDLNFNTISYFFTIDSFTTYYGNEVNISDVTISGTDWQLVTNQTFNLTEITGLFFKYTTNSQRTLTNAQSNDLYINLTIDGQQLISKKIRSMSGTSIGVSGFFENYTASIGSHNLEFYMREEGNGDVNVFNTDFGIISSKIQNNESVCAPLIQRDVITFNNQDFQPIINFSMNDYDSRNIIQFQGIVNASGTSEIDLYIQHVDDGHNSTFIERYISSNTDTGSIFDTYFDEHLQTNKNFSIYARSHNNEFITLDSTLFGGCMDTINGTKIQTLSITNSTSDEINNITLTAGTHRLFSLPVTMKNGTSFFIESTISFKSQSGAQIPLINVSSVNGLCNSVKQRTLSNNNDIGNAFITCVANTLSPGDSETFFLDVTVGAGETLDIIDETLNLWETVELDLTTINIPPTIVLTSDLTNITAGQDTSVTVSGTDVNGDNINLNITWYVNGVEKLSENQTIASGSSHTFTLGNGNYIAGQFVNATITSDDDQDSGNTIFTSTVEVVSPTSTTDALLGQINTTLNNFYNLFVEVFGLLIEIIWVALFLIIAIKYGKGLFYSLSGLGFVFMALRTLSNGLDNDYNMLLFFIAMALAITFILGGLVSFFGGLDKVKESEERNRKIKKGLNRIWN